MKNLILSIVILFAFVTVNAQTQSKAISSQDITQIYIKSENLEIRETKGSRIVVETAFKFPVECPANIQRVIAEKYSVTTSTNETTLFITPIEPKQLTNKNGENLKPETTYIIYLPENIKLAL